MLDLHPASSDQQRLWSHLLKDEGWTRTYQKASIKGRDRLNGLFEKSNHGG